MLFSHTAKHCGFIAASPAQLTLKSGPKLTRIFLWHTSWMLVVEVGLSDTDKPPLVGLSPPAGHFTEWNHHQGPCWPFSHAECRGCSNSESFRRNPCKRDFRFLKDIRTGIGIHALLPERCKLAIKNRVMPNVPTKGPAPRCVQFKSTALITNVEESSKGTPLRIEASARRSICRQRAHFDWSIPTRSHVRMRSERHADE